MFGRSRERCCPAPSLQALVVWGHVSLLGGFWGQAAFGHLPEAPASGWSQGSKSRGSFQKKLFFFLPLLGEMFCFGQTFNVFHLDRDLGTPEEGCRLF